MAEIETTTGSQLLDHRQLMQALGMLAAPEIGGGQGEPDLTGLIEAALGGSSELATRFTDAFTYYGLAPVGIVHCPSDAGAAEAPESWPALLPKDRLPPQPERAVVVGVLDEALPFARPELNAHLASVWAMAARSLGRVPFGTEVTGIDLAVPQSGPGRLRGAPGRYDSLGVGDMMSASGRRMHGLRSHGASVMALAVSDLGAQHPVVGVGFPAEVVEDTSGALLPYFILAGILHVLARTRALSAQIGGACGLDKLALPVVINISYGVLSGPKDGTDPMSLALDALCAPDRPDIPGLGPVHIVWPMGNGRQVQSHAVLAPDTGPLSLHLLPDDRTPSYVALRAPTPADGSFDLRAGLCLPGDSVWTDTPASPKPGSRMVLPLRDGSLVHAYFSREATADGTPRDAILLAFCPTRLWDHRATPLTAGRWTIRALSEERVELFVQRDDSIEGLRSGGRQARLGHATYRRFDRPGREIALDADPPESPVQRWRSVNAYATGHNIWRVGGSFDRDGGLVPYSGLGTPGGTRPAEGDAVVTSDRSRMLGGVPVPSFFGGGGLRESGTSVAAPQVARALAEAMTGLYCATSGRWPDRAALETHLAGWTGPVDPQTRN